MKKYIVILSLYFIYNCSLQKKVVNVKGKSIPVEDIVQKINHYTLPKTFKAMANVHFKNKEIDKRATINIRMLKDQVIWVNASFLGFSVVKIKITPTKFEYLNRFESKYISANINAIEKIIGTKISFNHIQSILLGKSIFRVQRGDVSVHKNCIINTNNEYIKQRLWVSLPKLEILSQHLQEHKTQSKILIRYDDFTLGTHTHTSIPKSIKMYIIAKDKASIEVNYRNIQTGIPLKTPFKIPNNYKREAL